MRTTKLFLIAAVLVLGICLNIVQAGPLYFTATDSQEIWVADTDGSVTPSVLFSAASPAGQGPVGIAWDMSAGTLFWGTGNSQELWTGNADGSGGPTSLYGPTGSFGETHGAAVNGAGTVFFTRQAQGLWSGAIDGSGASMIAGNFPTCIDYDAAGNMLYVGSILNGDLSVVTPDGSSSTSLYATPGIRDVALDATGGMLYWVDLDNIWAAPIDGTGTPAVLFTDMGGNLRTIDFDPSSGKLFLGEFATASGDMIWTANADGSGSPTVLYSGDFGGIRGLTVTGFVPVELVQFSVE
jgi:hypothetical protein